MCCIFKSWIMGWEIQSNYRNVQKCRFKLNQQNTVNISFLHFPAKMTDKPKEEDCADEKLLSHDKEGNGSQVVVSTGKDLGKQLNKLRQ